MVKTWCILNHGLRVPVGRVSHFPSVMLSRSSQVCVDTAARSLLSQRRSAICVHGNTSRSLFMIHDHLSIGSCMFGSSHSCAKGTGQRTVEVSGKRSNLYRRDLLATHALSYPPSNTNNARGSQLGILQTTGHMHLGLMEE